MFNLKKKWLISLLSMSCVGMLSAPAYSANWLMLQGTESEDNAPRIKVWGFIQAQYQKDYSDPNPAGGYIPPKLIGPDLTSQDQFNVNRARLGARGTGFPLDSKVNYFILAEFGNNAITNPNNDTARLTDASITLNEIPHARVRAGLFKYPGPEEGLQAITVFNYINFTEVSNQLMLERFPNQQYSGNVGTVTVPVDLSTGGLNQFNEPVGAFRDTGIQIFDSFDVGSWEHSYAFMYGNGNGLNMSDPDDKKTSYYYWSSEKIFGGAGPFREGLKMFAWYQGGDRELDQTDNATYDPQTFNRIRRGLGVTYLQKPFRATAEYMSGNGMIFVGPDKPTFDQNLNSTPDPDVNPAGANGADGKAYGYYVEGGWYIPNTKWELDLRYDYYERLQDDQFQSDWETWTAGVQYHFNRKTRATVNFAVRDVNSPNFGETAGPNANMYGIGNRASVQLTHIF